MWTEERLSYLVMLAFAVASCLLATHDCFIVVMAIALTIGPPVSRRLNISTSPWRLIPYGLVLAVTLTVIYYVSNLMLFPYATYPTLRVEHAINAGVCIAVIGTLWAATWGEIDKGRRKRSTMSPKN